MAIQFQYNKTSLQALEKNLKMRVRALPTIKNKESALRVEVKRAKDDIKTLEQTLELRIAAYDKMLALWGEFDTSLLKVEDVKMSVKKFADGLSQLKELAQVGIEQVFSEQKLQLLEHARKKTTQKVNLFEKVQIPGYEDAILKIKRFMEDEENLSKSSQKIVKSRQQKLKEEEMV